MSVNIVIIDYGMGNLRSVQKAFEKVGFSAIITRDFSQIQKASHIVLPGVGAFGDAMTNLNNLGLVELLNTQVLEYKKPFLGICLGMQLLAKKGYEFGEHDGLGWIDANVVRFKDDNLKIPHVGWNNVDFHNPSALFKDIPDHSDFYFVHSYYFDAPSTYAIGYCNYGVKFVCAIQKENIFATQFHPEKSQIHGLKIIENFANFTKETQC
ncbi:MAG: imidazole glycerol phosphate synthase subunit HisH [Sulfurimonas sp.]|uniref:imidazole glycerol phosphate synthase subunit HisH n=1 Tax=unclassified Sulfurimonas TaxID=2623549 RepID=UPI000B0740BB|nr:MULTISPECIES: imidazole glycerol phosphate synthase subunit HisH [unclassified Sulfurimonas]MDD3854516.1 imidazole glycerol phosphate synthase subunit HisH [Sulfurimonas sp.]